MVLRNKTIFLLVFIGVFVVQCQEKDHFLVSEKIIVKSENFNDIPCENLLPDTVYSDFINLDGLTWDYKERASDGSFMAISFNKFGNDTLKILPIFVIDDAVLDVRCNLSWVFHGIENERIVLLSGSNNVVIDTSKDQILFYLCERESNFGVGNQFFTINHHSSVSFEKSLFFK